MRSHRRQECGSRHGTIHRCTTANRKELREYARDYGDGLPADRAFVESHLKTGTARGTSWSMFKAGESNSIVTGKMPSSKWQFLVSARHVGNHSGSYEQAGPMFSFSILLWLQSFAGFHLSCAAVNNVPHFPRSLQGIPAGNKTITGRPHRNRRPTSPEYARMGSSKSAPGSSSDALRVRS